MMDTQKPIDLLIDYDLRARNRAAGLPAQIDGGNFWSGVAFTLRGQHYISPIGDIHEILRVPEPESVARIPGTFAWVKGVANVRGRLLPLVDLGVFFSLEEQTVHPDQRVLVLEHGDLYCGLVVDLVSGIQRFGLDAYENSIPDTVPEDMRFCMAGSYQQRMEFLVISFKALAKSEKFMQGAPVGAVA